MANNCFNLINPLAWFVQKSHAQTMPSLRSSSGTDLKVKPMLGRRSRAARKYTVKTYLIINIIIKTRKNY